MGWPFNQVTILMNNGRGDLSILDSSVELRMERQFGAQDLLVTEDIW